MTLLSAHWAYFRSTQVMALAAAALSWLMIGKVAGGDTLLLPPLEELLADAVHVARIRITDRRAVMFEFEGRRLVCGYVYQANLLENLKGKGRETTFFGDGNEGFVDTHRDYFALVFERTEEEAAELRRTVIPQLDDLGRAHLECQMRADHLFVKSKPQTLVPFERGTVQPNEEWVVPTTISAIPTEELGERLEDGRVRWPDLKRAVLRLMAS